MAADLEAVRREAAVERHREADVLRQRNSQRSGASPGKGVAHAAGEHKAAVQPRDDAARLRVSRRNANGAQTRGEASLDPDLISPEPLYSGPLLALRELLRRLSPTHQGRQLPLHLPAESVALPDELRFRRRSESGTDREHEPETHHGDQQRELAHDPPIGLARCDRIPLKVASELRGKDSNLDYLIQSQASYH